MIEVATSLASKMSMTMIRGYQHAASGRPSPCRYVPTCSTYALEAIEAHGALKGGWLATRRLCRCHPWGGSGFDPVPGTEGSSPTEEKVC